VHKLVIPAPGKDEIASDSFVALYNPSNNPNLQPTGFSFGSNIGIVLAQIANKPLWTSYIQSSASATLEIAKSEAGYYVATAAGQTGFKTVAEFGPDPITGNFGWTWRLFMRVGNQWQFVPGLGGPIVPSLLPNSALFDFSHPAPIPAGSVIVTNSDVIAQSAPQVVFNPFAPATAFAQSVVALK